MVDAKKAGRALRGPAVKDYTVPAEVREQLKTLLGDDAGPQLKKWLDNYDRLVAEAPSPLSEEQRRETDRVVKYMWKYVAANSAWLAARRVAAERTAEEQMREHGMAAELLDLKRLFAQQAEGVKVKLPAADSELGQALARWEELCHSAYESSALSEPNWNVPTTDGLEAEVRAFIERAAKSMKREP